MPTLSSVFWATWCEGCQVEIPRFIEFENKYEDRGLVIIGVSMDKDGWKSVKPWLKEKRVNYPMVIGNDDLGKLYGLESMPMTLLIDRNGNVAASHIGIVDKGTCESDVRLLLQEGAKNTATAK